MTDPSTEAGLANPVVIATLARRRDAQEASDSLSDENSSKTIGFAADNGSNDFLPEQGLPSPTDQASGQSIGDVCTEFYRYLKWRVKTPGSSASYDLVTTLVDTGSERCYVTKHLVDKLQLWKRCSPYMPAHVKMVKGIGCEELAITMFIPVLLVDCPPLGLADTKIEEVRIIDLDGCDLIIGSEFIFRHSIDTKIRAAAERLKGKIPDEYYSAGAADLTAPMFDGRKKDEKKKDKLEREKRHPEIDDTLKKIMAAKSEGNMPAKPTSDSRGDSRNVAQSGTRSHSGSMTMTRSSTASTATTTNSVFSATISVASMATTVSQATGYHGGKGKN